MQVRSRGWMLVSENSNLSAILSRCSVASLQASS